MWLLVFFFLFRKFKEMALRSTLGRLESKSTLFILCDLQERFRPIAHHFPAIVKNSEKLVACGKKLNINLIVSEQNPDKLGRTVSELNIAHARAVYPKLEFSILGNAMFQQYFLNVKNVKSVILFGLETHVCIEQTAMDLLDSGYDVHIVADCTTSRSTEDRMLAFQRLRQIGCLITTSENVIFKLLGGKNHPLFSEIRPLLMKQSAESGLAVPEPQDFVGVL